MNTLLTIGGCILGYLIIGLCWARGRAVKLQAWINEGRSQNPEFTYHLSNYLIGNALAWPLVMVFKFLGVIINWAAAPVDKRREKVRGLRARADEMADLVPDQADEESRRILQSCVDEYRQLAKELDI